MEDEGDPDFRYVLIEYLGFRSFYCFIFINYLDAFLGLALRQFCQKLEGCISKA
jgi:hypothetical protein